MGWWSSRCFADQYGDGVDGWIRIFVSFTEIQFSRWRGSGSGSKCTSRDGSESCRKDVTS
jgi:hypothetical protein